MIGRGSWAERKGGKKARRGSRSESGLASEREGPNVRRGREGEGRRTGRRRAGGKRGDTTRVVHPVLDDEQDETRTTTASYPRPPDRSINGEIDAFSVETNRVRGTLGRTSIFHPAGGGDGPPGPMPSSRYHR